MVQLEDDGTAETWCSWNMMEQPEDDGADGTWRSQKMMDQLEHGAAAICSDAPSVRCRLPVLNLDSTFCWFSCLALRRIVF